MALQTLSATSLAQLFTPSKCELRTWLRHDGKVEPAAPGPFEKLIQKLGMDHEKRVLDRLAETHGEFVDLDGFANPRATHETTECVGDQANVYQGRLERPFPGSPEDTVVAGLPDFLYPADGVWVIADAKAARKIFQRDEAGDIMFKRNGDPQTDKEHIVLQLQLYGWLFEQTFEGLDFRLIVFTGAGDTEEVPYDGGDGAMAGLERVLEIRRLQDEPWELFGNSKCGACGYKAPHCGDKAFGSGNLGLIPGVDGGPNGLGTRLHDRGYRSFGEVFAEFEDDPKGLAAIKSKKATLGPALEVLENLRAWTEGKPVRRRGENGELIPMDPAVTDGEEYVMFDLEGVPPDLDNDYTKIYLWGMQIFRTDEPERKGEFEYSLAEFSGEGDEEAWWGFLAKAKEILDGHPGIRFVHWHRYERDRINGYVSNFGDDEHGTAARVLEALLDILDVAKETVALPLIGYSLKLVEKFPEVTEVSGFSRSENEIGKGDDSVAGYIEAVETDDPDRRQELVDSLLDYNQQDLEATWAVMLWLRSLDSA